MSITSCRSEISRPIKVDWLVISLFTASASISILAVIGAWDAVGRIASLFH